MRLNGLRIRVRDMAVLYVRPIMLWTISAHLDKGTQQALGERPTLQARLKRSIDVCRDSARGRLEIEALSEALFIAQLLIHVLCPPSHC